MFDITGPASKRYCNLPVPDHKNVILISDVNGATPRMFNITAMVSHGHYKFSLFTSYTTYIMHKIITLYGYIWVKIGMVKDSEDIIRTLSLVAFCPVVYVRIFFRFVYTVRLQMIQLFNSIIMRPRYTP